MPPWVRMAGSALAEPNDQKSGTDSQSRSAASQVLALADVEAVVEHAAVRERDALGRGRGARRVEDEGHVGRRYDRSARSASAALDAAGARAASSAQRRTPS